MKNNTQYPFTAAQFNALGEEERQAVLAVAEYLTSSITEITDEDLSMALNLMRPSEGGVPFEEIDMDVLVAVRRKFAAVYQTAMELAEAVPKTFSSPSRTAIVIFSERLAHFPPLQVTRTYPVDQSE